MRGIYVLRNSMFYAILAAVMSVMFGFACLQATVFAEEEAPDVVTDWAGLSEWLDNHRDTGGTVVFGANIEADEIDFQGDRFALPVVIDTGSYGLTAVTSLRTGLGGLNPNGYLTITGEGIDTPVLSYSGVYYYSSYYLDLSFLTILAYGREGQGGTAFYSSYGLEWQYMGDSPNIYSNGVDAVGIDCGGDVDISWLTLESDGMAIRAAGDIRLFGCHIKGDLSGFGVTLDSCETPDIPGATVIHRKLSSIRAGRYLILGKPYVYQVAGRPVNGDWFSESRGDIYYHVIMSADGWPDEYPYVYVKYSREDIDTETIGAITRLPAQFFVSLEGLNIMPEEITFDLTVETVDGRIPHFIDNQSWGDYRFNYLYTGETLAPLTLWRSDDDGVSWYKIWRDGDPELTGAEVNYYDDILTVQIPSFDYDAGEEVNQAPFLLAFETDGLTGGHIVFFDPATGEVDPDLNGDRDGGDRMILPWEVFDSGDSGDAGNAGSAGKTSNAGATGYTGYTGDSSSNDNTGDPQTPPLPDVKNIAGSGGAAEGQVKETQEDTTPPDLFPVIQHGDNLILEQEVIDSNVVMGDGQPLAAGVEQVSEMLAIKDDPDEPEAGEQQETGEKAASVIMDSQLFQTEQPADRDITPEKNGLPVIPVAAGAVAIGGAGSAAYLFSKRRLFHK